MWWWCAQVYARGYRLCQRWLGIELRGLGWLLRRVGRDRVIELRGRPLYFNARVGASYGLHIIGLTHEPETHVFLDWVFSRSSGPRAFVDVGANVGVMLLEAARFPDVALVAIEPSVECVRAIRETLDLNGRPDGQVWCGVAGAARATVAFDPGVDPQGASVLNAPAAAPVVTQYTLDDLLPADGRPSVWLIDVEGYETEVLRGARAALARTRPIVIFEYNAVSKRHFRLQDVRDVIGPGYRVYRLRRDGWLDDDVEDAWNCVAIPSDHPLGAIAEERIRPAVRGERVSCAG